MTTLQAGATVTGVVRFRQAGIGGTFDAIEHDRIILWSNSPTAPRAPLIAPLADVVGAYWETSSRTVVLGIDAQLPSNIERSMALEEAIEGFGTNWPVVIKYTFGGAQKTVTRRLSANIANGGGFPPRAFNIQADNGVYLGLRNQADDDSALPELVGNDGLNNDIQLDEVYLITKRGRVDSDGVMQELALGVARNSFALGVRYPGPISDPQDVTVEIAAYSYRSSLARPFNREDTIYPAQHSFAGTVFGMRPPNFYANAEILVDGRSFVVSRLESERQEQHIVYCLLDEV